MSYTVDIQVLEDGEPLGSTLVRISIGEAFPGGRHGIYGDQAWTDEEGHASFEVPEYDGYGNKYVNFKIDGSWYGSWSLDKGGGYTVDIATDDEADDED